MNPKLWLVVATAAGLATATPARAQDISGRVVVYGRVVDVTTLAPLAGAQVTSVDSSTVAITDSLGNFVIPLPRAESPALLAEQFGYLLQRFDLGPLAAGRVNVVALEPAPFQIEAIDVAAEASLTRLNRNLRSRRAAAGTSARAFDRDWLDRFGPVGGSVMDLVFERVPRLRECYADASSLCVPGRFVTFRDPFPEEEVLICIDERRSIAPASELAGLLVADVALVEVFGRAHVRVYTARWMLTRAGMGHTLVTALVFGC